jgi:hypothetical protein
MGASVPETLISYDSRTTISPLRPGSRFTAAAVAALLAWGAPAAAQDMIPAGDDGISTKVGVRYWFSTGETRKDLYDTTGDVLVSRLTYDGLDTHSGEVFGEVDATWAFLRGTFGIGGIVEGNLQDEDFPPATTPYSSTNSDQRGGDLGYVTIDLGGYVLDREAVKFGGFVGYNLVHQQVEAYGCTQTAGSAICVPAISDSTAIITQENDWHSLRVGLTGEVALGERITISGQGAWLPYLVLDGADSHLLRICGAPGCFTGPIPEDGEGWGYQFEGMVEFGVTDRLSVGVGGRYWYMETSGDTHFEDHVVGIAASPQPVDWSIETFGILAQAKYRF